MKSISIKFQGEYWDYLIKYDLLYLWGFDGTIEIYDWEKILDYLNKFKELRINEFFFEYNKHGILYTLNSNRKIENREVVIDRDTLSTFLIKKSEIHTKDLAISIDSYNNKIIFNTDEGLYLADLHNLNHINKIHELSFYDTDIGKYGKVALSAGEEGVFGFQLRNNYYGILSNLDESVRNIKQIHSNKTRWIGDYIFNTSYMEPDILLGINKEPDIFLDTYNKSKELENYNIFDRIEGKKNISWTNGNKIYQVLSENSLKETTVEIDHNKEISLFFNTIYFQSWKGEIIDGASTIFGTVVECKNALVVMFNGNFENIPGEPIRWKVYKESSRYKNLLCIVYDNEFVIKAYK